MLNEVKLDRHVYVQVMNEINGLIIALMWALSICLYVQLLPPNIDTEENVIDS